MTVPVVAAAPAFVGRGHELVELGRALAELRVGRGGLVLVTGEPGIGKTRLLQRLLADEAVSTAWATCPAADVAPALWPWTVLLRQCADERTSAGAATAGEDVALLLRRDADALASRPASRFRLFEAVAEVLARVAQELPLVLVLDDLHRADDGTVRLLQWLVETLVPLPFLVIVAYRDGDLAPQTDQPTHDPTRSPPLADALPDLVRCGSLLALRGLPADELVALVSPLLDARSPAEQERLGRWVHRWAGGNPFFVRELLRLLEAEGRLGGSPLPATLPVPGGVRAVVARRLARLPQPTGALLGWAAVIGTEVPLAVLAAAAGLPTSQVLADLDPALTAGLLVAQDDVQVVFAHDLVRETLFETAGLHDRASRHWAVGQVLATWAGEDVERTAAAAAHLLAGAAAGDAAEAVRWAERAAELCASVLAHDDAAQWYERALHARRSGSAGDDQETRLLLALGTARGAAGQPAPAREALLAAAGLARTRGDSEQLAAAALGLGAGPVGFEVGLFDQEQIDLLQEALAALPPGDSPARAALLARSSVALTFVADASTRQALAEEALDVATRLNDDVARAHALVAWCDAVSGPDDTDRRLDAAEQALRLAARAGSRPLELLARRLLVVGLLEKGRLREASAAVSAYERGARVLRQPLYEWYVPLWRATLAMAAGDLDESAALTEQAAERGSGAGSGNAHVLVAVQRFVRLRHQGRFSEAAELLNGLQDEFPGHASPDNLEPLGLIADVLSRRLEHAQGLADALAAQPLTRDRCDSEWLPDTVLLALAAVALRHRPLATLVRDALLPYAELFVVEGIGAAVCGSVAAVLGPLAEVLGDRDEAERCARLAEQLHRDAGMVLPPPPLAAGPVPAPRWPTADPGAALRREGDVWALTWDGTTVRVRDSKGLRDLALLLRSPGRAMHVAELTGVPTGTSDDDLDAAAVRAYRRRLAQLQEDIADADRDADVARASGLRGERDAVAEELRRGLGLAGRRRRSGDPVERARKAVAARLRDSIARVSAVHPALGRHLDRSVRTGTWCSYEPEHPVSWRS